MAPKSSTKPLAFDQPGSSDVHVDAPLGGKKKKSLTADFHSKLYDELKAAGADLSQDAFRSAIKKARSHAGGKQKAANRALTAGEMSYGQIIEMINAELREEFEDPFRNNGCQFWYAQEIYPDRVIVRDSDEGTYYQIPYTMVDGECEFGEVEEVEQTYTPKAATEGNNVLDLAAKTHGFRLFNQVTVFAEPPDRIPLMPKPSTHKHANYGDIVITKARNKRFAKNINDHVYQEKIPIDLEHQLKLSGAAGYITSAEINTDGSVDGLVEWTDLGREAIENDRYAYVSPEWYDSWTHPMSEETFADVVIGAALTTRPFFKEESLRPLVANESGLQFGDIPKIHDKEVILHFTALAPVSEGESMPTKAQIEAARALVKAADLKQAGEAVEGKSEEDIKAARSLVAAEDARITKEAKEKETLEKPDETVDPKSFAEVNAQLKQMTERVTKAEAEVKKANERADKTEKENRAMQFTETVKEWPGDKQKNVDHLEFLFSASDDGLESDVYKAHVETMNAAAAQLKGAGLFTEIGSAGGNESGAVTAEVEAGIVKQMSENKITREQAFTAVWETLPPAKREGYRLEQRSVN